MNNCFKLIISKLAGVNLLYKSCNMKNYNVFFYPVIMPCTIIGSRYCMPPPPQYQYLHELYKFSQLQQTKWLCFLGKVNFEILAISYNPSYIIVHGHGFLMEIYENYLKYAAFALVSFICFVFILWKCMLFKQHFVNIMDVHFKYLNFLNK